MLIISTMIFPILTLSLVIGFLLGPVHFLYFISLCNDYVPLTIALKTMSKRTSLQMSAIQPFDMNHVKKICIALSGFSHDVEEINIMLG